MPRRNRRGPTPFQRLGDWPADLRPLIARSELAESRPAELGTVGSCRWTGKARYPDERSARVALAGAIVVHNRGREQRREQRAYACDSPACGGWHLTSLRTPPVPAPRLPADGLVSGQPGTVTA